jgi:hypothetical protein
VCFCSDIKFFRLSPCLLCPEYGASNVINSASSGLHNWSPLKGHRILEVTLFQKTRWRSCVHSHNSSRCDRWFSKIHSYWMPFYSRLDRPTPPFCSSYHRTRRRSYACWMNLLHQVAEYDRYVLVRPVKCVRLFCRKCVILKKCKRSVKINCSLMSLCKAVVWKMCCMLSCMVQSSQSRLGISNVSVSFLFSLLPFARTYIAKKRVYVLWT